MGPIVLLDRFTYVAPASGGDFNTAWVHFPSDYAKAELWVDAKTHDEASTLVVTLQSSMDTDGIAAASVSNVTTAGLVVTEITSSLGSFVRLNLASTTTAAEVTLSVWLVPKRD